MGERARWQLVAWAVAAALAVFVGAQMLAERRDGPPTPAIRIEDAVASRAKGGGGPAASGGRGGIYVHVAGAVRRPGLVRVRDGARVAAAVARAGGTLGRADLTAVNLAQLLEDGQQVIVPRAGAGAQAGLAADQGVAAAGPSPSLATATVEQLEELDGIGPTLAERIVEYRESNGGFRSLEELLEVDGIGEKRHAALTEALRP
ncbi:MAG: ComEA family DNA-binding protein [Thermoleophilaceae bacterium]